MKVVKVAKHCCIRVQKMALPLLAKGYDVHLITERIPLHAKYYRTVMKVSSPAQLYASIKAHADADVFHCHNEPSWFVTVVKEVFPNKPVILDVHDSLLGRVKEDDHENVRISVDERNNMALADGLVFVSATLAEVCRRDFKLDSPYTILPSYVPERFNCIDSWRWLGGITYEGRVDLPEKIERNADFKFFSYCDYTDMARKLRDAGIGFYIYAGAPDPDAFQEHYGETAIYKGQYPYEEMIRRVGRHDWGLVGNIDEHPAWQIALPNKLFEYMAAGIPIAVFNATECAQFVKDHGVGVVVNSVEEFKERWGEKRECRNNVLKKRRLFAMEYQLKGLENLYDFLTK